MDIEGVPDCSSAFSNELVLKLLTGDAAYIYKQIVCDNYVYNNLKIISYMDKMDFATWIHSTYFHFALHG